MSEAATRNRTLSFRLAVEEDWPPVAVEALPFRALPEGYECQVAPLFIKDLCVGDVIQPVIGEDDVVDNWCHIHRSDHSTVWLLRLKSPNNIQAVLSNLRALGCSTVSLDDAGSFAIDVPGNVAMFDVDGALAALDSSFVATAFPTVRHPDA